ncbi:uncharacterized protein SCHCODRAFT_02606423 [Schizophyllum commune H4-8]|uniref:uncharacterized protein n=1 Tax=Schizophyllum commune (strain H4-8 / FGSC 9210) TaxID=578458 RepID=UPI00215FDF44|nr:uncharacterized protein SCHCODRAFT_02606423 [Schizophyllum commune H4-8]KAI5899894.1 hypothetical protein SCHCODRAFT_02606423 [Schizophyllum commune H4-8]
MGKDSRRTNPQRDGLSPATHAHPICIISKILKVPVQVVWPNTGRIMVVPDAPGANMMWSRGTGRRMYEDGHEHRNREERSTEMMQGHCDD